MEKLASLDRKSVISVLTQGKELANELKKQLHPTATSNEACDSLLENILSSYENALRLLNCMALLGNGGDPSQIGVSNFLGSAYSIEGSPRSEVSEHSSKDHQPHRVVSKKRKTLPRWSEQVRVCSETGSEGQLDDGYNWRKYGQKDILGANHPRAYYRCTHRKTQGCLATKQVQRADEDPSIFEVIYSGKHSCIQERLKQKKENLIIQNKEEESQRHSQQMLMLSTEPTLKVETQELDTEEGSFPYFSFPSTPIDSENVEPQLFPESTNFIGTSYTPPFLSPATSESYFSFSPCPVNDFGIVHSLQSSESDFAEIISNPTPATSFPFEDLDFLIDQVDFGSHFLDANDCL
ncbi:probable WRKY transcription factor 41 [Sesamum indicum]|uniref:Probable WRKY transcription factor 41 n=1 Tax=Sesamum indicum TaxID=4182 RepID=A0A6I9U836_SESIN|nr:probable WRKY transcription factor 41 [Sesamum indicum]